MFHIYNSKNNCIYSLSMSGKVESQQMKERLALRTNYKVQSIEKAMCLMKLFYFNLEAGITEIGLKEEPTVVREITERHIQEANCNSPDYEWLGLIGVALFRSIRTVV